MKYLFAFILIWVVGCDPSQFVPKQSAAEVLVNPASGGGGNIEPATIPIRVSVEVTETRTSDPFTDDATRCTNCGCQLSDVAIPKQSIDSSKVQQKARPLGSAVTRLQSGYVQWIDSAGVYWNYPPGTSLIEGQVSACGQWRYQNGRMVDLRGSGLQSTRESGVRYERQCTESGCYLRRID